MAPEPDERLRRLLRESEPDAPVDPERGDRQRQARAAVDEVAALHQQQLLSHDTNRRIEVRLSRVEHLLKTLIHQLAEEAITTADQPDDHLGVH